MDSGIKNQLLKRLAEHGATDHDTKTVMDFAEDLEKAKGDTRAFYNNELAKEKLEAHDRKYRQQLTSIDILLFCPNCGEQHIDGAEPDKCEDCGHLIKWHFESDKLPSGRTGCGHPNCKCDKFNAWLNPPHKSHRCHECNHVWRPSDVPTNGVAQIETKGENDGNPRPRYFATAEDFNKALSVK